ncbi:MAG: phosphoribosylamine--glycine ligase, partial [Prevotellaceae bacterium]|nr:phosphoribosylamine--glycine ligase [Prevotellaceae bacterium]
VIANRTPVITWDSRAALGIVMASKGYPGIYPKGFEIRQLHTLDATVYHMGTQRDGDRLLTGGGRVLFVTVLADTLAEAQAKALSEVRKIDCEQLFYRSDIGHAAIDNV